MSALLCPATSDTVTGGRTLELSGYDKIRKPYPVITDDNETITIGVRTLATELTCPICLDLLNVTMTTKECLHRFCNECITMALQRGNRECPTCRKKIVSKRSLRRDENFDELISTLWADRKVYDDMQTASLGRLQVQSGFQALQKSIEAGIKAQAANRRQKVKGSYDYERRRRRPRNQGSGESTPDVEMEEENQMEMSDLEPDDDRERDRERIYDFPSDLSDDDDESESSSDVSSDSSMLSFASSDVDTDGDCEKAELAVEEAKMMIRQPPGCKAIKENIQKLFDRCQHTGIPSAMLDIGPQPKPEDLRKLKPEIELELIPSILLQRKGQFPPICALSQYLRVPSETKISQLSAYIPERCRDMMQEDGFSDAEIRKGIVWPQYFYVPTPNGRIRRLLTAETVAMAFAYCTGTTEHLLIFFDTDPLPRPHPNIT